MADQKTEKKSTEPRRIAISPGQLRRLETTQQAAAKAADIAVATYEAVLSGHLTDAELGRAQPIRTLPGDKPAILVRVEPEPEAATE